MEHNGGLEIAFFGARMYWTLPVHLRQWGRVLSFGQSVLEGG